MPKNYIWKINKFKKTMRKLNTREISYTSTLFI